MGVSGTGQLDLTTATGVYAILGAVLGCTNCDFDSWERLVLFTEHARAIISILSS